MNDSAARFELFIDGLEARARVGIYDHERKAAQPVVLDMEIAYVADVEGGRIAHYIDYDAFGGEVARWLEQRPHTDLLETLLQDLARMAFDRLQGVERLMFRAYKPGVRVGAKRMGVTLRRTKSDFGVC